MPLNRLIENSGGYAGFADNCHTPVNEKPEISSAALLLPKNRCLRLPRRFLTKRSAVYAFHNASFAEEA